MLPTCSRCGTTDSESWNTTCVSCLCERCAQDDMDEFAEIEPGACWVCGAPTNEAEDLCGPCAAQRVDTLRLVEDLEAKGYGVKR